MKINGTGVTTGKIYLKGDPVIVSNNLNNFTATVGSAVYTASNTVVTFTINQSVPYLSTGTTYVIFPNLANGVIRNIAGATLTANINGLNVVTLLSSFNGLITLDSPPIVGNYVTVSYPWQEPQINQYNTTIDISFRDDTNRIANVNYLTPIDTTTTSNIVVIRNRNDLSLNMAVTGLPGIVGQAIVTDITGSDYTITYPVQSSTTLSFPLGSTDSNMYINGDLAPWPYYNGSVMLGGTELVIYGSKDSGDTAVNTLTRYQKYQGIHAAGTRVSVTNLISNSNILSNLTSAITNVATTITLSSNITTWPSTGSVLVGTNEICSYSSKSGQDLTVTRPTYARAYPAGTNVIFQNTYTYSSLVSNLNAKSNSFVLTAPTSSVSNWPTANAVVCIDNEVMFYGNRSGNSFTNCNSRTLTWSTIPAGTPVVNMSVWQAPIMIKNLTDFVEAPRVIFEEIQLTDEERQYIKTKPRRLVVNHVVKEPPLYFEQGTNGQITLNIGANFPVTFMCWFIRRSDYESLTRYVDSRYSYGYTTKYINAAVPITFFNGVKFNYIDLINSAQISLNGNPILSKLGGGVYFTMKQPFDRSLSIPTKSMYIYSFGLNPKEYNQGGFMDFSPLNSSTTTLSLEFNPAYATELAKAFSLYMFYYGYTVMEIKDGFGRLVFV